MWHLVLFSAVNENRVLRRCNESAAARGMTIRTVTCLRHSHLRYVGIVYGFVL